MNLRGSRSSRARTGSDLRQTSPSGWERNPRSGFRLVTIRSTGTIAFADVMFVQLVFVNEFEDEFLLEHFHRSNRGVFLNPPFLLPCWRRR